MVYIILLKARDLDRFKDIVLEFGRILELERYNIDNVSVVRVVVVARSFSYFSRGIKEISFIIEKSIIEYNNQYCPECLKRDNKFTLLPSQNKSGYCTKHRESDPKRLERKKSPKNRGKQ